VGYLRSPTQTEALRALDLKTGKLTLLQPLRSGRQPWALSADGQWIAWLTTRDRPGEQTGNNGPQVDVWKVPLKGGEPERIVRFPARIHDLCWSADGKALYASTELGGVHNDLWRIDLKDPERPAKLTFGQADEDRPSVSADGRRLLYADNHEGCPALVLLDLASGSHRRLSVDRLDFGAATGRLHLDMGDKDSGQRLVARVAIEHQDGSFHAPPGTLWRVFGDVGHFYLNGQAELDLPAGS
jgi:dipeptidyl aminopeptidase/acylaminoacyl peptidase